MRYSTVLKFIAVILCAATLLGAVGSAAGILFLTELGGKNVNEHYMDQLRNHAVSYAMDAGGIYVSQAEGGAHRNLVNQYWGNDWQNRYFYWDRVGYTLYDSEGNVVEEQEMFDDSRGAYRVEDILVPGEYIQVLSITPHEEYFSQETIRPTQEQGTLVMVMPEQGSIAVHSVYVDYTDGHREEWPYDGTQLGTLEYIGGSEVIFYSNIGELPVGDGWYPNHILFADSAGNIVYEAFDDATVLLGSSLDNGLIEWYLPAGTVTTAAPVGMNYTDGDYSAYDAIPTQGATVTSMNVTYANGQGETVGSEGISSPDLIGTLFHDRQGNAEFHSTEPMTMDIPADFIICHITFLDARNNMLFEASCPGGVGVIEYDENGYLVFRGNMPGTDVPEETTPDGNIETESGYVNYTQTEITVKEDTTLYSKPAADADTLGILEAGTTVAVVRQMEELVDDEYWLLTQEGWIRMADVYPEEETEAEAPEAVDTLTYTTGFAREELSIHNAPSSEAPIVGTVDAWQEISIVQQERFEGRLWGQISGGWIQMDQVLTGESGAVSRTAHPVAAEEITDHTAPTAAEETVVPEETVVLPEETVVPEETVAATEAPAQAAPEQTDSATEPVAMIDTVAKERVQATESSDYSQEDVEIGIYYDGDQKMVAEFVTRPIPVGYTMSIQLAPGALRDEFAWTLLRVADAFRSILLEILGVCIAVFVLCVVHLCCSAGRTRRNNEVRAGGLNRIPLDLYFLGGSCAITGLVALAIYGSQYFARNDEQLAIICCGACAYLASLLVVGFFFAFVAQVKTPGGFWWRNTFCGWCIRLMILGCTGAADLGIKCWIHGKPLGGKFFRWLARTGRTLWGLSKKTVLWLWDTGRRLCIWLGIMIGKSFSWTTGRLARFFGLLPITWQFLTTGFTLVFLLYVMMRTYKVGYILLGFGIFFAVILYAASAFAILLESAKRMSKGDLDTKVDDRMLIGGFKDFAERLNDLAGVAVIAAQKQLKSERMKTELITNVSHDIKTPLTSIINYVDLMQKPHTQEQQVQYLEVLDRQSQRLKKLIDDLMEMSKASTGNMAVDIERVDAGEAVNQALGEFADKLEKAQLIPVFRQPEEQVYMMADGRLVWRVMSNLLGNAVKYALPGTRIYLDLLEMDGKVIISMKNISREELNVNADELMERFVRGDASRNTEGSGLGLNIAQSLMELQKGQLQILVDGDLFKVTMIFPGA